jgi:hypothetical protein
MRGDTKPGVISHVQIALMAVDATKYLLWPLPTKESVLQLSQDTHCLADTHTANSAVAHTVADHQ